MKIIVSKNNNVLQELDLGQFVINGGETTFLIGRGRQCHVCIDDKKISREHCELIYTGASWSIRPLSDFAPVMLNNRAISEMTLLNSGDIAQIDQYMISINWDESLTPTETISNQPSPAADSLNVEAETEQLEQTETDILNEEASEIEASAPEEDSTHDFDSGFADPLAANTEPDFGSDFEAENIDAEFQENQDGEYQEEAHEEYGDDYNDDFGDENYDVDSYDNEGTKVLSGFAKFSLELFGEFAPYDSFNIEGSEIFIGRDPEKCQIVLPDPEVSSVHAVIKKNLISCILEDLQSANGTILNGKRINSREIVNLDEFIIGSTTFTVHVGNEFIEAQSESLMPVAENQTVEVEEIVEVDEDDEEFDDLGGEVPAAGNQPLFSKATWQNPEKRKKIIYGAVVLAGLWLMMDDGDSGQKKVVDKNKTKIEKKVEDTTKPGEKKLTPEEVEQADAQYQLGKAYLSEGKYPESIIEFEKLFAIKKDYKNGQQLYQLAKDKLKELEDIERKKREEEAREIKRKKVSDLLKKAEKATAERNVTVAEALFSQIREMDPENYDVTNLELDLNAYKKEKQAKEMEEIQKAAERKRMVDALAPAKTTYLKEAWYDAIGLLEKFLNEKGMDEDLVTEATEMLKAAKNKLNEQVGPLLGKARSLREGEDLKGAYSTYNAILKYDPSMSEALAEIDDIRRVLTKRASQAYREAIVSESLGLFEEARQKFQEVQQIAPEDNEYYQKATDKLSDL